MTELPKMAAAANVLIMPYADLPVTRAMQPLKFKEYIATGRPVVTSSLPAVQPWGQYVKIVKSQAEFVQSTLQHLHKFEQISLRSGDLQLQLDNETWEQKTRLFEEMIAI